MDHAAKTWAYDVQEAPLSMAKSVADSLADALLLNSVAAVVVKSAFQLTGHPGVKMDAEEGGSIE